MLATLVDRGEWDDNIRRIRVTQADDFVAGIRELRAARQRGELKSDMDPALGVAQLIGPIVYRRLVSSEPVPAALVRTVVDGFLAAYRAD